LRGLDEVTGEQEGACEEGIDVMLGVDAGAHVGWVGALGNVGGTKKIEEKKKKSPWGRSRPAAWTLA
jgi:hypothetical protein